MRSSGRLPALECNGEPPQEAAVPPASYDSQ